MQRGMEKSEIEHEAGGVSKERLKEMERGIDLWFEFPFSHSTGSDPPVFTGTLGKFLSLFRYAKSVSLLIVI